MLALLPIRVPRGNLDGAVVELSQAGDGSITVAEIRIPGPAAH